MPLTSFTEDTLVQQTTADYLRDELGWQSVYAFDTETFGPDSLLGRQSRRDVVLTRYLSVSNSQITIRDFLYSE